MFGKRLPIITDRRFPELTNLSSLTSISAGMGLPSSSVRSAAAEERASSASTREPSVLWRSGQEPTAAPEPAVEHGHDGDAVHVSDVLSFLPPVPRPKFSSATDEKQASNEGGDTADAPEAGTSLAAAAGTARELTEEEQREVEKLRDRDREVRAHEQAHVAAAGPYSRGGPQSEYERGPDDRRYAVGGEVSIDTSAVEGDPEATIQKARVVKRAALAPAEPSGQDRQVAAEAARLEAEARREIAQRNREEEATSGPSAAGVGDPATGGAAAEAEQAGDRRSADAEADAGIATGGPDLPRGRPGSGSYPRGLDILA